MHNSFTVGARYNASQNISRAALGNGQVPLFYEGLTYQGFNFESKEHLFEYEGEKKWFDDEFINNGKSVDNSMVFGEITYQVKY